MNPRAQKKAPRREGRRGAEQRAWAGGQIKRAEQLKHGCPHLVPLQSNFFSKILRPMNLSGEAWLSFAKWEILPTLPGDSSCSKFATGTA
jgi:hypothetical protein